MASVTYRARFRLAYLAIPVVLLALLAASFTVHPHIAKTTTPAIDPADYGHVEAHDGALVFTLAPVADQRHKYELGLGRVMFTSAGIAVSNDGRNFVPLEGKPMGKCGYHWQGYGLNVLVAIKDCVPGWASVTGSPKTHAVEWVRAENLTPNGRKVLLRYDPMGG